MPRIRLDVMLTPLGPEHAEAMYRWVSTPELSRNLGLRQTPTLEKTLAWIARANLDRLVLARAIQLAGWHVGNVVVDHVDPHVQTGRLSVYVGEPAARGQGVGQTGIYLGLQAAFSGLALHKIWLIVHAQNIPAIHTYSKLGFQLEGILRDEFVWGASRENALYMGLLADEFGRPLAA